MAWYRVTSQALLKALERSGRARALAVLRVMDPRLLREAGISPELIEQGIDAWPWRVDAQVALQQVLPNPADSSGPIADANRTTGVSPAEVAPVGDMKVDVPVNPRRIDNEVAA